MRPLSLRLSPEDHAIAGTNDALVSRQSLILAVSSGLMVLVTSVVVHALFIPLGLGGILLGTCAATCGGFVLPARRVRARASALRDEFDMAIAVLLDLVNIQTAGGAGIETALVSSAALGDGWCFDEIRNTLSRAQSSRTSYWDGLLELGNEKGIRSLTEIACSARLAGEHGARVRQSLIAKATSLRARNLARIEHEAHQRTEQMGLPMVVLFVSFLVFIGYPAMAQTMGSL